MSEEKIRSLGLTLPPAPPPAGSYRPAVLSGGFAFLSGQISKDAEGEVTAGKIGSDLSLEQGKAAARLAALNVLSVIRHFMGLQAVEQVVRVVAYIQTAPDFHEISQVANGASDLLMEVFGEKGLHSRSAVGMSSLPMNAAVELEVTLKVTGVR